MTAFAIPLPVGFNRQDAGFMPRLTQRSTAGSESRDADAAIVARLRDGDESAFMELIDRYGPTMLRVAQMYVRDRATAEEVVQETWLAVLNGIDRFEQRSSLKTWLFRILTNRAKTRGQRESRMVPFAEFAEKEAESPEAVVDPWRFRAANDDYPDHWSVAPRPW